MKQFNMHEAKTHLSEIVALLESKQEAEIYLARNGISVAKIVPIPAAENVSKRIGIGADKLFLTEAFDKNFDDMDDEITQLFGNDGEIL